MVDIIVTVICVLAGCLLCFRGYKLFRVSLGIAGGIVGFILGRLFIQLTSQSIHWNDVASLIVVLAFALGFGVLAFTLYMKALVAVATIICAFWFYDDFNALFSEISSPILRNVLPFGAGILAGLLIGVIVYFAQKWTICLFTSFVGARIISSAVTPLLWSGIFSKETSGIIEHQLLGADIEFNYTLIRIIVLVAFCAAGLTIQLKRRKK